MHQVLMNLATNAAHAMKHRGGTLVIRLLEAPEQSAVKLVVEDTGDGMTEATLERVYEPFFTTKGPGEGTGLGLAMVHGIVTSLEGQIEITSAPGAGTTVSVVLPLDRIPSTSFANADPGLLMGETRQERVLLVDDEVSVLRIAQAVLIRLGYHVTSIDDPARALELLRTEEGGFDLLITDHSMPRMTGLELVRATRELKPDLPIIVATGYLEGGLEEDLASEGIRHILQKPYGTRDLAHIVDAVLQDNRVSAH
jgi:CheY-like chemotaxis protein